MFRLLKLMAFALFGYALYEFVRGMSAQGGGIGGMLGGGQGSSSESFGEHAGQGQLTGAGVGRIDETLDPDGGSVSHRVGRGAVGM